MKEPFAKIETLFTRIAHKNRRLISIRVLDVKYVELFFRKKNSSGFVNLIYDEQ